ncbi:acyltransferase family protein [Streptosporangiaceae bacterium NEAU-GS5]|nr:acyltransferase family protein [Streptosporangiaceae bacterium NEAU-GS5]
MSDTRRQPPVPGSRAGVAPDAPPAAAAIDDDFDYFANRRPGPETPDDELPEDTAVHPAVSLGSHPIPSGPHSAAGDDGLESPTDDGFPEPHAPEPPPEWLPKRTPRTTGQWAQQPPGDQAPQQPGERLPKRRPQRMSGQPWPEMPAEHPSGPLPQPHPNRWPGDAHLDQMPEAPPEWNPWRRQPLDSDPVTATMSPIPGVGAIPSAIPMISPMGPTMSPAAAHPMSPPLPVNNPPGPIPSAPLPAWAQAPQQPGFDLDQEPAPARRPREPFLDNAKFLLIALVVSGHMLRDQIGADGAHANRAAYIFIYAFHMPLFVVISGYLSRNFWNSNAKTNKLVDTFLVPYVIVETGYALLRYGLGEKFSLTITDPAWLNWYLIALLFWRLSTPVWKRMKFPLLIAVAVCLFSGFSELSGDFSMDRFFGLLPFFVLGLVIRQEHFELLGRVWARVLGVIVLGAWAGIAYVLAPRLKLAPFYFNASYHDLHQTWWYGLGFRMVFLLGAATLCLAVLSLVPRRDTWFSDLGVRTLYCYLLHGIPVLIAKDMGWLELSWLDGPLGTMAILATALAAAILLCLPITRTLFKWVLEPRLTWLYRRPSTQSQSVPQPEVNTQVPADSRA